MMAGLMVQLSLTSICKLPECVPWKPGDIYCELLIRGSVRLCRIKVKFLNRHLLGKE
ncbi:hypothetical protein BMETH_19_0 [methanotrophic bacterial endosymbiont of Bathymodiolus sp.]|nr:hypothetical protein BMETH_19_0 [methanotrophic bacterial endosymbiont of Bathymodiolus sp.]